MCSARWRARRRGGRLGAKPQERVSDGVIGAHLGVVAVRLDLYNRARNDAANTYERPAREVGGGIELKHPCAAKNARGAPSVKRRDHLLLFAFARVVHNEEGCHRSRAQRPRKLEAAPCFGPKALGIAALGLAIVAQYLAGLRIDHVGLPAS